MILRRLVPVATLLLLLSSTALAQPRPHRERQRPTANRLAQRARQPAKKPGLAAKRQRIRDRLRSLRAWELTEALQLDESMAGRLFPVLSRFDEKLAGAMTSLATARRDLERAAADPNASPAELSKLVDQALAAQRALWDLQEQRIRAVAKVLRPRQTAKIILVLPEIDRRIQRQIRRVTRNPKGRTNEELVNPFDESHPPTETDTAPLDPFQ